MTASEDLIGAVCASFATLADHVSLLAAEDYCAAVPELAGATIGQHVRHCMDHYVTLLGGIATKRIARAPPISNAIATARSASCGCC
ncbi:MAG: hypothetical protein ACI85K_002348 [Hyphomicrobiaceae bacterium]|jgi:hypothetical protein